MVHRRVYDEVGGYDDRYPLANDLDFWLRAAAGFRFRHCPGGPLSAIRRHGENTSDELVRPRRRNRPMSRRSSRPHSSRLSRCARSCPRSTGRCLTAAGRARRAAAPCRRARASSAAAARPGRKGPRACERAAQARPARAAISLSRKAPQADDHRLRLERRRRRHDRPAARRQGTGSPRVGRHRVPRRGQADRSARSPTRSSSGKRTTSG